MSLVVFVVSLASAVGPLPRASAEEKRAAAEVLRLGGSVWSDQGDRDRW